MKFHNCSNNEVIDIELMLDGGGLRAKKKIKINPGNKNKKTFKIRKKNKILSKNARFKFSMQFPGFLNFI